MREIKFRGKDFEVGNWWYATPESGSWEQFWTITTQETRGQYIGLKDKNGTEIYEGDIVKADWHWREPHTIVWPDDYYSFVEHSVDEANIEIIGNIHDNPELLAQP